MFTANLSLQILLQLKLINNLNDIKYQAPVIKHRIMEVMKLQNIMTIQVIPTRNKQLQLTIIHTLKIINLLLKNNYIHLV